MSRDPRAAVAIGEALDDRQMMLDAAYFLLDGYMPLSYIGGTEQHIQNALDWWKGNRQRLQNEAEELEKRLR